MCLSPWNKNLEKIKAEMHSGCYQHKSLGRDFVWDVDREYTFVREARADRFSSSEDPR